MVQGLCQIEKTRCFAREILQSLEHLSMNCKSDEDLARHMYRHMYRTVFTSLNAAFSASSSSYSSESVDSREEQKTLALVNRNRGRALLQSAFKATEPCPHTPLAARLLLRRDVEATKVQPFCASAAPNVRRPTLALQIVAALPRQSTSAHSDIQKQRSQLAPDSQLPVMFNQFCFG